MQKWGVKSWKTYAPVANWIILGSLLAIASIQKLTSISIEFVLAFPQFDLDVNVFMNPPLEMRVDGNRGEWVLKLNKSLYVIKKASKYWFDLPGPGLERRGYHQYIVDPCVFYIKDSIILTYVDDFVIFTHTKDTIKSLIKSLNSFPENHVLTDEGDISNYLGVNTKKNSDGTF